MTDENVSKVTSPGFLARWLLPALPLFMALFAEIDEAKSACAPAAPVTDSIVTCTGTTLNQNNPFGYGATQNARNIINVDPGASVTGTNIGVVLTGGGFANADTVNNFGTISGAFDGIAGKSGIVNNSAGATILGTGANGIGYLIDVLGTLTNSGTISGTLRGVQIQNGTVTNTSSGTISGGTIGVTIEDEGLLISTNPSLTNAGAITGGTIGVRFRSVSSFPGNLTNSGTISATGPSGMGVTFGTSGTVANSGAIRAMNVGAIAIQSANDVVVTNSLTGLIAGGVVGINALTANVSNLGIISGTGAGISSPAVNLANGPSGRVEATGAGGVGVEAQTLRLHSNSGTITGNIGVRAANASTVTNSGTIEGTGGTAIKFGPQADTLTLLPGSKIIGAVDMGGGADTLNLVGAAAITSRVSSLSRILAVDLPNLINFTGIINTINNVAIPNGLPAVQSGNSIATLDPTAFGQADRTLMNFTGGISSLVQGRLSGGAASGSAVQVVSFAPAGARGTEEAFAVMPAKSSTLGYAAERSKPLTHTFTYADAPYNVWTSGFGGTSMQKGDDIMLRSVASAGAGVIGIDRQVRPDLLVGAFAGGGTGRLSVEFDSQSVDTDYVTGGFYGRFDWVSHFLDFTLQGGATINKSKRQVLNGSAPDGPETATASYDSWYISPEIAYGRRYYFANGYTLTPMGRIRYLAGTFDGYNEAGSAQNLVVGRRTLHDLEERAEVELSKITGAGAGSFRTSVHGGLIALQRLGNPTINTVLIGQDLSFATPGKASTAGVVAGAGFDLRATDRMSLFGAFEATLMSDHSRTAAAKAGLKFAF
jgi:hypothetical protein